MVVTLPLPPPRGEEDTMTEPVESSNPVAPSEGTAPKTMTAEQKEQAQAFLEKLKTDSANYAYNWMKAQVPPLLMDMFNEMNPPPKVKVVGPVDRNDYLQTQAKKGTPVTPVPGEPEVEVVNAPGV